MRRTRFDRDPCPIARTADLLGDWWTPLVVRELSFGCRRFGQLQERLGVNRSVLSQRLRRLEDEGVVRRRRYSEHPPRHDYELTDKGRDLWEVLAVMWAYGRRWMFDEDGPPLDLVDKRTGETVRPVVVDGTTGRPLDPVSIRRRPTP